MLPEITNLVTKHATLDDYSVAQVVLTVWPSGSPRCDPKTQSWIVPLLASSRTIATLLSDFCVWGP